MAAGGGATGEQQGASAIIDPGSIASGDATSLTERGTQPGQLLEGGVAAGMFVVLDHFGRPFALRDLDRHDFPCQAPACLCSGGLVLAA